MSPSSTVHGGQHDTKCVTFELLLHAGFVADEIWGDMLEPARMYLYKMHFFLHICKLLSGGRGSFLALSAAAHAGGRRYVPPRRASQDHGKPTTFVFLSLLLDHVSRITQSLKLPSSLLCGSHGTTAFAHLALPFVTATDGASVCTYVAMFAIDLQYRKYLE